MLVHVVSLELVTSWPSSRILNAPPGWPLTGALYAVPETPGARVRNPSQLRTAPLGPEPPPPMVMGRELMRSPVMVTLCSAFSVRSRGASAVTVTDSVEEPTCRARSTRTVCATCTWIPGRVSFLKPLLSAMTS